MDILTARTLLPSVARSAQDATQYSAFNVDNALLVTGDDFAEQTRCTRTVTALTLTGGSDALPALPAAFRPEMLLEAYLTGSNVIIDYGAAVYAGNYYSEGAPVYGNQVQTDLLHIIPYSQLLEYKYGLGVPSSISNATQPTCLAFDAWTTGLVYPQPSQNFTLNFRWDPPFTQWTAGMALTTATFSGTTIAGFTINSAGSIYATAPTVSITGTGTGATATVTISAGGLATVTITAAGTGYTSAQLLLNGVDTTNAPLNVPDDWMRRVIVYGAAANLQSTDVDQAAVVARKWQQYTEFRDKLKGRAGGLGVQTAMAVMRRW